MLAKLFTKLRGQRPDFPPDTPRHWITDRDRQVVRVTYREFDAWRNRHHGGEGLTVDADDMEGTQVRTSFIQSDWTEGKNLFHTAVFDTALKILHEHLRTYDTWEEAERGHAQTVENVRAKAAGREMKPLDAGASVPPMQSLVQETLGWLDR